MYFAYKLNTKYFSFVMMISILFFYSHKIFHLKKGQNLFSGTHLKRFDIVLVYPKIFFSWYVIDTIVCAIT